MKKTLFFVLGLACLILNAYAGFTSWASGKLGSQENIPIAQLVQASAPPYDTNFVNPYHNQRSPPTNSHAISSPSTNQPWRQKIQSIIRSNKLEHFYPSAKLNQVFNRLNLINFESIARKWKIPEEMVYDLSSLALYNVVFYVDNSGSMLYEDNGARMDDLKKILGRVAEIMTVFDDDGISARFMNGGNQFDGIKSEADIQKIIQDDIFGASTPLGRMLKSKVLDPLIINPIQSNTLEKPVLILVITDGEPNPDDKPFFKKNVLDAYKIASSSKYGSKAFGLQITQVGQDSRAEAFLNELDNDPEVGKIIDATSNFEIEEEQFRKKGSDFSYGMWLTKLAVGAIDPFYDNQD